MFPGSRAAICLRKRIVTSVQPQIRPMRLFPFSNPGSVLSLISYPFLLERQWQCRRGRKLFDSQ